MYNHTMVRIANWLLGFIVNSFKGFKLVCDHTIIVFDWLAHRLTELQMMKKGAFIVNYARADVIQKQVGSYCKIKSAQAEGCPFAKILFWVAMCTNAVP